MKSYLLIFLILLFLLIGCSKNKKAKENLNELHLTEKPYEDLSLNEHKYIKLH